MGEERSFELQCPIPISEYPQVLMAHGGGGKLMRALIEKMFLTAFRNPALAVLHDGAVLGCDHERIAFTTDSYVVQPLFFPGGDIGKLAVYGTVNDLAMCGARPLCLSAGFILEEGLAMETLWRVVRSMKEAADSLGVPLVTGDTKVVERGKGDGIFINTAGIGAVAASDEISPREVRAGDRIILSGDIGRHGIAVMATREGLEFETTLESDCAPVHEPVLALLKAEVPVRCLRDLTRGGLASGLVEIAESSGLHFHLEERAIAVCEEVRGACEMLGLDPLYVANEGRFVAFVPAEEAERALKILRDHPVSAGAVVIGEVRGGADAPRSGGIVTLKSLIGATRIVDMFSGEQLPRIC